MGKASKWFRAVLGLKKSDQQLPATHQQSRSKEKRRWSFVKSYREKDQHHHLEQQQQTEASKIGVFYGKEYEEDPNKHAIAVAAATAAVAEAAVAAAQAAAEVVRLTSSGRCVGNAVAYVSDSPELQEDIAAVKIQAAFRGYLARRALRALKALVRLQALVRGHIERKRTAEWLQRVQSLLKAQGRARAGRAQISESSHSSSKSSHFNHPGPPTPEKFEHTVRGKSGKYEQSSMLKRIVSKSKGRAIDNQDVAQLLFNLSERRIDDRIWDHRVPLTGAGIIDDERSDKILEIDTGKPHVSSKRRNLFHSSHLSLSADQYSVSLTTSKDSTAHQTVPSPSSGEVQSLSPLEFSHEEVEEAYCTANNSPQLFSASSRGGSCKRSPFTATKSDGSRSFLSGYSDYYPNYMCNTESSKAKVRSLSAPKQRPQYERSSSTKRYSVFGFGELRSSSAQRASFISKAYPGSGRLDRLGMPVGQRY